VSIRKRTLDAMNERRYYLIGWSRTASGSLGLIIRLCIDAIDRAYPTVIRMITYRSCAKLRAPPRVLRRLDSKQLNDRLHKSSLKLTSSCSGMCPTCDETPRTVGELRKTTSGKTTEKIVRRDHEPGGRTYSPARTRTPSLS
jgi:hypothetical protein